MMIVINTFIILNAYCVTHFFAGVRGFNQKPLSSLCFQESAEGGLVNVYWRLFHTVVACMFENNMTLVFF